MKIYQLFQKIQNSLNEPFKPCITLVFKELMAIDLKQFSQQIPSLEPLHTEVYAEIEQDAQTVTGLVAFEDHQIEILGTNAGISDHLIETCIHTAHWQDQFKNQVINAKAHITLIYTGKNQNPIEAYLAVYKVASAFYSENLLGIINEPAWTFHPAGLLPKIISKEMINVCRNSPPFLFWTGFIKTSLDINSPFGAAKADCFFSKGHHVFNLPDIAFYSADSKPLKIKELFHQILEYAIMENKELQNGDCIGFSETEIYELVEPEEKIEFLQSPKGTLVLRFLPKDEFNQIIKN